MEKLFRFRWAALIALALLFGSVSSCANRPLQKEAHQSNALSESRVSSVSAANRLPKNWVTGCFTPGLWATKGNYACSDEENCSENQSDSKDERIEQLIEMMQEK